jgi:hypothetical protein
VAPAALRDLPGWLIWRYELNPGKAKPLKVPYYVSGTKRHGVAGTPDDRAQLASYDAACLAAAQQGFTGVGFAALLDFGIVALDFDNCVDDFGIHPEVERIVEPTYAEISPSGTGVRAFFKGQLDNRKDPAGKPFGLEVFSTAGFVTFTGHPTDNTILLGQEDTVAPLTPAVLALHAARFGDRKAGSVDASNDPLMAYEPVVGLTRKQLSELLAVLPDDLPYESSTGPSWLGVGMALHHETGGDADGFALWDEWSAQSPKYSSSEYGLFKWDSFGKDGRVMTTARSLIKWAGALGAKVDLGPGSAEDFQEEAQVEGDTKPLRFLPVPAAEFADGEPPGWIIKAVLPKGELVVLFGESGSGKSFVALDLCMSIARGEPWREHRTKQGQVVYIAAEGGGGFRKRLKAYAAHHEIDLAGVPFDVIHGVPNFLQRADAVDVARSIAKGGPVSVVVVDTFAQVMPGANENASEDMGVALAHCRGIHRATGATIMLVHHSGKDTTKGARGWSGLRAAADAEIEVVRGPAGRAIRVTKQKDGDDMSLWGFDLKVIPLGLDEDGDTIDSCVAVEAEVPVFTKAGTVSAKTTGKWERLVLDVVGEIALGQTSGIEIEHVIEEVARRAPAPEGGKRDTRKQHARRALKMLSEGDEAPYFIEDGCLEVL